MEKSIDLYQYYYGIDFIFNHVDGEEIRCKKEFIDGNMTSVFKNKGLPYYNETLDELKRGHLYVFFKLVLKKHEELNPDIKSFLNNHFSEYIK